MRKTLIKRLISGLVLLWFSTSLVFFLMHVSIKNIAQAVVGGQTTNEIVEAKAHELQLDLPLWVQYTNWISHAITGDLGTSWAKNVPVLELVMSRVQVTLSVVIVSLIFTSILAIFIGVISARKRGWLDQTLQGVAIVGTALPSFWVALVLITALAVQIRIFPATGFVTFETDPLQWFMCLVLPVLAISVAGVSGVAMQIRSAVIDLTQKEFVRTLESHGLSRTRILFRHVLRNAAGPALAILSIQFVGMLSGAVVIEKIFALPGLGVLAVESTSLSDIPVVMGVVAIMVALVVTVNLIVDILSAWLNPKVRIR